MHARPARMPSSFCSLPRPGKRVLDMSRMRGGNAHGTRSARPRPAERLRGRRATSLVHQSRRGALPDPVGDQPSGPGARGAARDQALPPADAGAAPHRRGAAVLQGGARRARRPARGDRLGTGIPGVGDAHREHDGDLRLALAGAQTRELPERAARRPGAPGRREPHAGSRARRDRHRGALLPAADGRKGGEQALRRASAAGGEPDRAVAAEARAAGGSRARCPARIRRRAAHRLAHLAGMVRDDEGRDAAAGGHPAVHPVPPDHPGGGGRAGRRARPGAARRRHAALEGAGRAVRHVAHDGGGVARVLCNHHTARRGTSGGRCVRRVAPVDGQRRARARREAALKGGRARMNAESWQAILRSYRADEAKCVAALIARIRLEDAARRRIADRALVLARQIRRRAGESSGAEAFLRRFGLSSREGVVLMCLAEALLRIPDAETADALIRDKLAGTQWEADDLAGGGLLLNAATWGLMLTGTLTAWADDAGEDAATTVRRLVGRAGEPFVRGAIRQAMKIMAEQCMVGETIDGAIERAAPREALGYRYSYDMLGEAARTAGDAERYFAAYEQAIDAVGRAADGAARIEARPGI